MHYRKKLGKSLCIQLVFEYSPPTKQLHLQLLSKRVYKRMIPCMIKIITLYEIGGYFLSEYQSFMRVFDKNRLYWKKLQIREAGVVHDEAFLIRK